MNHRLTGILMAFLLLAGCKVPQTAQQAPEPVLPDRFSSINADSTPISLNYRSFFRDSLLLQLIDSAVANNWDMQIALQRMEKAGAELQTAAGLLKPRVDAAVSGAIRRFGRYTMDGAGNSSTFMLPGKIVPTDLPDYFTGFQSYWEVDLWGKLKNRKKAALARFLATAEGRHLVRTRLVSEVADAYYERVAADQALKIVDETIATQQRAFDIVKAKKEAALLNELAVKQFEAQLANLQAYRKEIELQILATENKIHTLTARFPRAIPHDTSYFYTQANTSLQAGLPAQLLENRPDIRQAALELTASRADLAAAKAALNPQFIITASLGYQGFRPDLLFRTPESLAYTLVGGLAGPLINRSALRAAFRQASAAQLESLYHYYKTLVEAYLEVHTEMERSLRLEEVYQLKVQETRTLSQSVSIAEELFRTGRATYLEVIYAQQQTLRTKMEMVEARKRLLSTSVHLYRALGGGWKDN